MRRFLNLMVMCAALLVGQPIAHSEGLRIGWQTGDVQVLLSTRKKAEFCHVWA